MKELDFYLKGDGARAVIFGGAGAEHEISRLSAFGFISEAERVGIDVLPIFIDKNGNFYIYRGSTADIGDIKCELRREELLPTFPVRLAGRSGFLLNDGVLPVRLAVPVLHGDFGEDGRVQGLLECAGIPLFGADTVHGALMSDKANAKAVAECVGVRTLPQLAVSREEYLRDGERIAEQIAREIGCPAFIKPTGLGSSIGASAANTPSELCRALDAAFAVSDRVMAEPRLSAPRELECAYLSLGERVIVTPPAEVAVSGGFYDFENKYFNTGRVRLAVRADIPDSIAERVMQSTRRLAAAFGARHIARFDYFLAEDGTLYFNEVNSFPGLTAGSLYTRMLEGCGVSYADFVREVLTVR